MGEYHGKRCGSNRLVSIPQFVGVLSANNFVQAFDNKSELFL
jgi:hypothetical protein